MTDSIAKHYIRQSDELKKKLHTAFIVRYVIMILMTVWAGYCFFAGVKFERNNAEVKILPVATRQRELYKRGFLEYKYIDGKCGDRTHDAQEAYEQSDINDSAVSIFEKFKITE